MASTKAAQVKPRNNLTPQQRAFISHYLPSEMKNAAASYRYAYPKANPDPARSGREARRLLAHPLIARQIEAARAREAKVVEQVAEEAAMSKVEVVRKLAVNFRRASEAGQFSAAARTAELLGKLGGWITERRDVRVIRSLEDMTDDELAALLADTGTAAARSTQQGKPH